MSTPQAVSIVILMYNGYDHTNQLLMDIKRHCCNDVHEVLIIDNGSDDPKVHAGLDFWVSMNVLPIRVVTLRKNRGFVGGMNYGLNEATGDIVLLFSNDVRIYKDCLVDDIKFEISKNRKVLIGSTLYTHDTGWNTFNGITYPYVEGYFLAATKDAWNEFDGFDVRYAPSDYEDVDLSTRAIKEGYKLVQLNPGIIQHLGAQTYGYTHERLTRTHRNRGLFMHKWGIDEK